MIYGNVGRSGSMQPAVAGVTVSYPFSLADPAAVVRVAAYLDGLGSSAGSGAETDAVGVIYRAADGALMGAGKAVRIPGGMPAQWVTLGWDEPGFVLAAGSYRAGVFASAAGIVRIGSVTGVSNGYGQQPTAAIPTVLPATTGIIDRAVVLEALPPRKAPIEPDDPLQVSRLPIEFAQAALAEGRDGTPLALGEPTPARAGWHGPSTDPEAGFVAIARTGGPLEDLVGERVRVSRSAPGETRSVVVYCHDEQAWPADLEREEDLSLSRRAWLEVAELPEQAVDVTVRVLG